MWLIYSNNNFKSKNNDSHAKISCVVVDLLFQCTTNN